MKDNLGFNVAILRVNLVDHTHSFVENNSLWFIDTSIV